MAITGLASVGLAEPSAKECNDASAAFAEFLERGNKPSGSGLGWVLYPPAVDFDSLSKADQWKNVAGRISYEVMADQLEVAGDTDFARDPSPEAIKRRAAHFLVLGVLEECLRAEALTASPEFEVEIKQFDMQVPPEARASLRSKMKARL